MTYQSFAMTYQCKLFTPVNGKQWEAVILSSVNYLHQLFSHRTAQAPPTEHRFIISHCWWIFRLEIRKVPEGPKRQGEKEKWLHPPRSRCLLSAKRGLSENTGTTLPHSREGFWFWCHPRGLTCWKGRTLLSGWAAFPSSSEKDRSGMSFREDHCMEEGGRKRNLPLLCHMQNCKGMPSRAKNISSFLCPDLQ